MYWLGFSVIPGIGPVRFECLLKRFGSAKDAWKASAADIEKAIKSRKLVGEVEKFREGFSFEEYIKQLHDKKVWFVTLQDKEYPCLLKQIDNPPFVLYGKGDKGCFNDLNHFVGVVGTRKVTNYGRQVTELLTAELVNARCVIVSGLALGVDAIAHQTTIENNGKTIAVLGSGVDICYPSSNSKIYNEIVSEYGAVISEYPLGMKPSIGSFPSRNRIIAGFSQAVLVTEGAEDSGSLITASNALEFGRKVFAVPGPITSSLSKGPNSLIGKGAKLVTSGGDILRELGLQGDKRDTGAKSGRLIKGETKEEQKILDLLQNEELSFDEIVKRTKSDSSKMSILLSMMEIKGMIVAQDGGMFRLK